MQRQWMRGRALWRPLGLTSLVAASLLVGGAASRLAATPTPARPAVTAVPVASPPAPTSYADAVSRALPAVVTVHMVRQDDSAPNMLEDNPFFRQFFGGRVPQMQAPVERGLGSGVIVKPDGTILTNNHVVDHADRVTVTLSDGREYTAKVVGTDAPTDLAVLHIDATSLPTLPLSDSDRVRVGDVVLAVGDPLGVGETVTMGIISAKGRTTGAGDGSYEDFLQTDAPINPGNSGGALITAGGELVGINSQILTNGRGFQSTPGNIGIGFAIPSNMAKNVMTQLLTTGHVRRGRLGVTIQPVTSGIAKSLGLDSVHGALVNSVEADGPAAAAGIEQGDVIVSVNGQTVEDANDLRNRISETTPGTDVTIGLDRHGAARQVHVKLAEMPASGRPVSESSGANGDFGMTLEPLTPSLADRLHVAHSVQGVAVTGVDPSSAAAAAGIQNGDVITQIDGRAVKTPDQVRQALTQRGDKPALAYVHRGDSGFYVALGK